MLNVFWWNWLGKAMLQWSCISLSWHSRKGQRPCSGLNLSKPDRAQKSHLEKHHLYSVCVQHLELPYSIALHAAELSRWKPDINLGNWHCTSSLSSACAHVSGKPICKARENKRQCTESSHWNPELNSESVCMLRTLEESVKDSEISLEPWEDTLDLDDTEVRRNCKVSCKLHIKEEWRREVGEGRRVVQCCNWLCTGATASSSLDAFRI